MLIGLIHYKTGTDGVSLEMQKRAKIFKSLGARPVTITGSKEADYFVPEIGVERKKIIQFNKYAFEKENQKKAEKLFFEMEKKAEKKLLKTMTELKPDFLVAHNLFSLAYNLPASSALAKVIKEKNIKTEAVHHDFWWDREIFKSDNLFTRKLLLELLPPAIPQIFSHVTINSIERKNLLKRKGIKAKQFGDIFDFENSDRHSKEKIKKMLKLKDNEIVLLQASRVLKRKAIEVSIDIAKEFEKSTGKKTVILLTNPPEKYVDTDYFDKIKKYALKKNIKLIHAFKKTKKLSFFEFYKIADFAVYPTIKEGFGNQFLEAVYYKTIPIIFEYPVFRIDLKKEGYYYISLGSKYLKKNEMIKIPFKKMKKATLQMEQYLKNKEKQEKHTEHNYKKAEQNHSPQNLKKHYSRTLKLINIDKKN